LAVFKILEIGDPLLREKARPVEKITPQVHRLLNNMAETMYHARGVGLAAPQIGVSKRAIVVDVGEGLIELLNPEITAASGAVNGLEGCLSIPGLEGEVVRAAQVTVKGLNRHGTEVTLDAEGWLARVLQHEIDHLDGILFVDRATTVRKV
jgi:peptide deformylase